ncbi:glycosyltransferase [Plantactinospora sp. GCM10030261]|uniref:glycosyltransferase n=1 Tax=Plantactinospora sp. GCM10030261 TaxID=3273420 RepID=UPI0036107602
MRVLLLTPFAPDAHHHHAAADTIVQLTPRLAEQVELFVYSPQHSGGAQRDDLKYTVLPATVTTRPSYLDRFRPEPAWLRQAWPREATREAAELIRRIRPDVVHAEYLQSAEVVSVDPASVLGLHDITEKVMVESYRASSGLERPYRLAEVVRTRRFERAAIRRAAAVITLSDADLVVAARYNPHTLLARPGIHVDDRSWSPPAATSRPRLVFAGAMWRRANVLVAQFLVRDVMPLVWRDMPEAELRIVGAEPAADVVGLGGSDSRVVVTGAVPDLRAEMLAAHTVVVPSIVGGGVLMKVAHAMALGCPVITSSGPADSVRGDASMLYVASTAGEIAAAVRAAVEAPADAAKRGRRARAHIERTFRWDDTVRSYLDAYRIAGEQ